MQRSRINVPQKIRLLRRVPATGRGWGVLDQCSCVLYVAFVPVDLRLVLSTTDVNLE